MGWTTNKPPGDERPLSATAPAYVFARHYLLERVVATSATSAVWRGVDQRTNEAVAVKFFSPELIRTPGDFLSVRDVIVPVRRLSHPHVVAAREIAMDRDFAAVIMPWIEAPTLAQLRLAQPGQCFDVPAIEPWMRTLVALMESAHAGGLIHGALHTDVIFAREHAELGVTGFGINAWLRLAGRALYGPTREGPHAASVSPALRLGATPGIEDDVFAFGALVYELLTGTLPRIYGRWRKHVRPRAMDRQRPKARRHDTPVPTTWEELIQACLEPDATRRPRDFVEIRTRLGFAAPASTPPAGATPMPAEIASDLPKAEPSPTSVQTPHAALVSAGPPPAPVHEPAPDPFPRANDEAPSAAVDPLQPAVDETSVRTAAFEDPGIPPPSSAPDPLPSAPSHTPEEERVAHTGTVPSSFDVAPESEVEPGETVATETIAIETAPATPPAAAINETPVETEPVATAPALFEPDLPGEASSPSDLPLRAEASTNPTEPVSAFQPPDVPEVEAPAPIAYLAPEPVVAVTDGAAPSSASAPEAAPRTAPDEVARDPGGVPPITATPDEPFDAPVESLARAASEISAPPAAAVTREASSGVEPLVDLPPIGESSPALAAFADASEPAAWSPAPEEAAEPALDIMRSEDRDRTPSVTTPEPGAPAAAFTVLPPRPPRRYVPSADELESYRPPGDSSRDDHHSNWGTGILRALVACTIIAALTVGGIWTWRMYETRRDFVNLWQDVLIFPPNATPAERQEFEARLVAARTRLNTQQWQIIRDAWSRRETPQPTSEVTGSPTAGGRER